MQKLRTDWSANYYKICCDQKEILEEVVRELQKVKEEIIDGESWEDSEMHDHFQANVVISFQFFRIFTFFSLSFSH